MCLGYCLVAIVHAIELKPVENQQAEALLCGYLYTRIQLRGKAQQMLFVANIPAILRNSRQKLFVVPPQFQSQIARFYRAITSAFRAELFRLSLRDVRTSYRRKTRWESTADRSRAPC
jgi:hypothetical protein